jgi:NADPH-dependent glutamate synthase beta subunit-like oxidoreductase
MNYTDLTKPADLLGHAAGTGPLRKQRPEYTDFMPPCNSACPAGENIQSWMDKAQSGNYFEAFQVLMEDNPFPAIMGRVCVRSCETGCNRNHIDNTVSIHAVERYIGDRAIEEKWMPRYTAKPSGKKVLVVGSGPAGLSAAYHLARMGHAVSVYEGEGEIGGLMRYGIPAYRLPRPILEAELQRLVKMGITFRVNYKVKNLQQEKEDGGFDAVFLGIGAQAIHAEDITCDEDFPVTDAFTFLKTHNGGQSYDGKKVLVYGGGKLAMYIARILKRLGAEAIVLFPGDRKLMPAYDYEADDAMSEGVEIGFLRRINEIKGRECSLEIMRVEKGKAIGTGEFESITADRLILALRQESESNFLRPLTGISFKEDGTVVINASRMTGAEGVFAGGDVLPGEQRSVTISIGHGKKAARFIDGYLSGEPYTKGPKHQTANFKRLHMWYKTYAPLQEQFRLHPLVAVKNFDEVISGLTEKEARYEAQRCLSCGNCFECDGCYGSCPEEAIIKLGPGKGYRFDLDKCTGCAVCYEQCPCHAIEMIPEPIKA